MSSIKINTSATHKCINCGAKWFTFKNDSDSFKCTCGGKPIELRDPPVKVS